MAAAGPFLEEDDSAIHNVVTCNIYSVILLTQQVIKSFAKRYNERKQRSLICNTSALAAICPIPNGAVYSASKIAGDFIGWGLTSELKKYKTDVCMWRAAGVSTKIINSPGTNCCVASPEKYVKDAFSKCTSGVHSAFITHEIMHLVISNIKDIFGIGPPMWFFSKLFAPLPVFWPVCWYDWYPLYPPWHFPHPWSVRAPLPFFAALSVTCFPWG